MMGLLVWIFTSGFGGLRWFEGLFLALIAGWLLGRLLIWASVQGRAAMDGDEWQPQAAPPPVALEPGLSAQADDLKQIRGIGPKLEQMLQQAGITRFAQIAAWDDATIDAFAQRIGRMGSRIRSDDWVGQARALSGGDRAGVGRAGTDGGRIG